MSDDKEIDLVELFKPGRHSEVQIIATSVVIGLLIASVAFAIGPGGAAIAAAAMAAMVATGHISDDDVSASMRPVEIKTAKRKSRRPRA